MTSDVNNFPGEHSFAHFVRILGKGKTGSRSLSQEEARQAFRMILSGQVEDVQLGAFLMLLRVKEETHEEIAGFVQACREEMTPPPSSVHADLDWSSYAGKRHQHPWYILSMLLLAEAGLRVMVHGSAGHTPGRLYTEQAMLSLGLPVARNWTDVSSQLDERRLSYLPLEKFCAPLEAIMQLRPLLGLRSPVNTLARLINPAAARYSIQSIFHPAYAQVHQQADLLLGQPAAIVFKGDGGEAEIKPQADTLLHLLSGDVITAVGMGREIEGRVKKQSHTSVEPLRALWRGDSTNTYGLAATLGTVAVALLQVEKHADIAAARERAEALWQKRNPDRLD